jgi:hypothetical protein
MDASTPLQLSREDKLDVLRQVDEFRFWHSLDDQRRCTRCDRLITGNQILAFELKGTRGRLRLQCPTAGCVSTPGDWNYADPMLAAKRKNGADAGREKLTNREADARFSYRPAKAGRSETVRSRAEPQQPELRRAVSFREVAARLPILRSIATRFHAFHPVP